jgi:hypothetical protein
MAFTEGFYNHILTAACDESPCHVQIRAWNSQLSASQNPSTIGFTRENSAAAAEKHERAAQFFKRRG